jgi:hypothetical protein
MPLEVTTVGNYSVQLTEETLCLLQLLELDAILNLDDLILRGPLLHLCPHGVWSFHHGDPQKFRGAPPGFWEMYSGSPTTGAVLQRLEHRLDNGVIIRKGEIPTVFHDYPKQREALFAMSIPWPAEVARDILSGVTLVKAKPKRSRAAIRTWPTHWQTLWFWFKLLKAQIRWQLGLHGSRVQHERMPYFKKDDKISMWTV